MNFLFRQKVLAFFVSIVLASSFAPAVAFSVQQSQGYLQRSPYQLNKEEDDFRAFNIKSNNIKKAQAIEEKEGHSSKPASSIVKHKEDKGGFQWGNLMGMALKLFSGPPSRGTSTPIDKVDNLSQLTSGELSWTKIISLGLQLVLSFFGNDNIALDKMDPGSPIEAFLTAAIAYFTGSNNPSEVSVMAKQATELWGIVISLLDALRTSFSQRSFEARAIGSNDLVADAAVASTSMMKSFIKTYNTEDDICMQKYVCEANKECSEETSDSGYLFCQMATYALSYALEGQTFTPFEILNDAGRMGRLGENCATIFKDCEDKYF